MFSSKISHQSNIKNYTVNLVSVERIRKYDAMKKRNAEITASIRGTSLFLSLSLSFLSNMFALNISE